MRRCNTPVTEPGGEMKMQRRRGNVLIIVLEDYMEEEQDFS